MKRGFRILVLGELGETSFGMLELGAANFGILYQKGFCSPKGFWAMGFCTPKGFWAKGFCTPKGFWAKGKCTPKGFWAKGFCTLKDICTPKGFWAKGYWARDFVPKGKWAKGFWDRANWRPWPQSIWCFSNCNDGTLMHGVNWWGHGCHGGCLRSFLENILKSLDWLYGFYDYITLTWEFLSDLKIVDLSDLRGHL